MTKVRSTGSQTGGQEDDIKFIFLRHRRVPALKKVGPHRAPMGGRKAAIAPSASYRSHLRSNSGSDGPKGTLCLLAVAPYGVLREEEEGFWRIRQTHTGSLAGEAGDEPQARKGRALQGTNMI